MAKKSLDRVILAQRRRPTDPAGQPSRVDARIDFTW